MASQKPPETRPLTERRFALRMQQPLPKATVIDRVAFLFGLAAAVWIAVLISIRGFTSWWGLLVIIPVWAIIAYIALPRLHKILTDLYVPDYFFGRTRTADGLLGDPVNLAMDGSLEQLNEVMKRGGWLTADEINLKSTWGIIASTLTKKSYPTAPVSPLMLFGRRHDVAYQQEVAGNPKQRHHVRFWHCPPGWLLPGGTHVDWLGAGTYDTDVGVSLFTFQITHRIDANTDIERDFVVKSAMDNSPEVTISVLKDFTTGYHSRNGGGDLFITDGNLPILEVNQVKVPEPEIVQYHQDTILEEVLKRPLSTILGVTAVLLATVLGIWDLLSQDYGAIAGPDQIVQTFLYTFVGFFVVMYLLQAVIAIYILRGGRRSRYVLMIILTVSIIGTAVSYLTGEIALAFNWNLLAASLQAGALVALSSTSSGDYAADMAEKRRVRKEQRRQGGVVS